MEPLFKDLLTAFGLNSDACQVQPLGQGHIHDTFFVDQCGDNHPPIILQKINNYVFKDVELLSRNMELVTTHIAYKNRKAGKDPAKNGILLLEDEDSRSYIGNEEIGYWRMFWFIEGQKSFEVAENAEMAFEGGRVIAEFQSMLSDLDPEKVGDTIPRFHDLRGRMDQFNDSLKVASKERLEKAADFIEFSKDKAAANLELFDISEHGDVPVRLTHCDTKFNNILYGPEGKATCMIDLDTVMKGYSWFDFGDALRTCASIAPEDEEDVNKIGFRIEIFESFARGYIAGAAGFLTKDEVSVLHRAPIYFAYMQGLRFLTDYLNNDVYYKTEFPEHNFQRARAQYTLMERMLEQQERMSEIIIEAVAEFMD